MCNPTRIGAPAAPGNGATVTLLDTTKVLAGGIQQNSARFATFDFTNLDQASAAAGLKGYKSHDRGATWVEDDFGGVLGVQIPTGDTTLKVYIGSAQDVKFTYLAGAAGPTVWNVSVTIDGGELVQV